MLKLRERIKKVINEVELSEIIVMIVVVFIMTVGLRMLYPLFKMGFEIVLHKVMYVMTLSLSI